MAHKRPYLKGVAGSQCCFIFADFGLYVGVILDREHLFTQQNYPLPAALLLKAIALHNGSKREIDVRPFFPLSKRDDPQYNANLDLDQ